MVWQLRELVQVVLDEPVLLAHDLQVREHRLHADGAGPLQNDVRDAQLAVALQVEFLELQPADRRRQHL